MSGTATQLRRGLAGRNGERLPLLGGIGLMAIVAAVAVTAALRDPKSLEGDGELAPSSSPSAKSAAQHPGDSPRAEAGASAEPIAPEPQLAPVAVLDRTTGVADLEKLADQFPNDPKLTRKLLLAYADDPKYLAKSVGAARRMLAISPEAAKDEAVRQTITRGVSGPPSVSESAFESLQTSMGSAGGDILYDVASAPSVAQGVRDRAWKALKEDAKLREAMTPALRVAVDLKAATGCQRKSLFPAAEKEGDRRSLAYLEPLQARRGCGVFNLGDCYDCLGSRADLTKAIAAIKARSAKR